MGKEELSINRGVIDQQFLSFDIDDSLFQYHGFSKAVNYTKEEITVQYHQQGGFGGETLFEIPLQGTMLGKVTRRVTVSALTATADSYARWVDGVGHAFTSQYEAMVGTEPLPKFNDITMDAWSYGCAMRANQQDTHDDMVRKNKSQAERDTDASAALTLEIPLPFYWTVGDWSRYVHQHSLAQLMTVRCYNRTLAKLCEHDGTAGTESASITADKLVCDIYHLHKGEGNHIADKHHQGRGMQYNIIDFQQTVQQVVASTDTTARIKLDTFKLPCRALIVLVRLQADLTNAGGASPCKYFNYQPITNLKLSNSNHDYVKEHTGAWNLQQRVCLFPNSRNGDYIYVIPFSQKPDSLDATGHLTHSQMTTPELVLTLPSLAAARVVDVISVCHNTVQHIKGEVQKNWH